jgi:hypothetical protein
MIYQQTTKAPQREGVHDEKSEVPLLAEGKQSFAESGGSVLEEIAENKKPLGT